MVIYTTQGMISTIIPDGSLDGGPVVGSSTEGHCSSGMHSPRNSTSPLGQKHPASNEKLCIIFHLQKMNYFQVQIAEKNKIWI